MKIPKLGIWSIQRRQLTGTALEAVNEVGMHDTTIIQIAHRADTSTGIISHYFRNKNGPLGATMRGITSQLRDAVSNRLHTLPQDSAELRLQATVGGNFDGTQVNSAAMKAWLAFWASSMHQPMFYRLQRVSSHRLLSNLASGFRRELPRQQTQEAGYDLAALIDGLWLRAAPSGRVLDKPLAHSLTRRFTTQRLSTDQPRKRDIPNSGATALYTRQLYLRYQRSHLQDH